MEMPRNALVDNNMVFTVLDTVLTVQEIEVHKINAQSIVFNGLEEGTDLVIEPLINASNNMTVYKLGQKDQISKAMEHSADSNIAAASQN